MTLLQLFSSEVSKEIIAKGKKINNH